MKRTLALVIIVLLAALIVPPVRAAERYQTFLFGAAYYPEHWPESYWEQDATRMQECGVNVVRMAEFAWAVMEPRKGTYDFSLFDKAIAVLARHGIKTIIGTPTATPPKWLTAEYPEVLHVNADGRPADDQSRRHICYNSAVYRDYTRRIVEAMVQHFKDNPNIIGWQIDNELNCENHECYSEPCAVAFRAWLKQKYGTLNALNERWGTRVWSQWYTDWQQIKLPRQTMSFHNPGLMLDFKRFGSDSADSYKSLQVALIRRQLPQAFITTNGVFKGIDYYQFARDLDLYSYDSYPTFSDVPQYGNGASYTATRGFNGRWMIMEQQTGPGGQTYLLRSPRPGEMNLWAWQAIAHGADGMLHFRWRTARRGAEEYWSGVLEHDNIPRARYQEFKKEGAEINKVGKAILGSQIVSDIAVIKDFEAEWVFDHQYFTHEVNVAASVGCFFQAASEMKYNIDFIPPAADFSKYKIIFGPQLVLMDDALAAKIKRFVEQGGTFVMSAHSAVKDRDNAMTERIVPILLDDLFGVERDEFNCYQPPSRGKNDLSFEDGAMVPVNVFADVLQPKSAQVIATWNRDYLKGRVAATEKRVGRGKAVYYGSFFNTDAARYLLKRYAAEQNLRPLFTGLPKEVEVTRRTKDGVSYTFILNHASEPVTLNIGAGYYDLLADRASPATVTLKAFEYRVLRK
ncbi:MAG TPA: beta-galactosidase [Blastocatellia bacterium]|nr:beta-galactosidase [Blastocatellia bacterium]